MANPELRWHTLGDLLDDAATRFAERPFLIFEDARVTFGQARDRAAALAAALHGLGLAKGDRVAVMLPNGFDFPVAWLAIARLGAVLVPVNINYREHDLQYVLADSGAAALLIHADYLEVLAAVRPHTPALQHVVVFDGPAPAGSHAIGALLAHAPNDPPRVAVGADDLLNIQYTSGTTGFPKGCMLTHRYWLLMASLVADTGNVDEHDVDMTVQPFFYMDPQWNTALCLQRGIPLVIMRRFSPSQFWGAVHKHGVTFFYVIGTMPFFLMKQDENPALERGHKVRLVMCSGIHPDYHAEFERRWGAPWREGYGMTETGVDLVAAERDVDTVGSGAMGRPVATKRVRVIDAEGCDVARGDTGEMIVSGEPMMLGYWNKPGATAEIVRDGWLRTGDLVFEDGLGYFHWVGRLKDMVRRSGENISTAEVEGVLVGHPAVRAAAVVPVPDALRGEEVKAYLVPRDWPPPEDMPARAALAESVLAHARAKLAYFKVPRYVEFIAALPLTPSERVEKHRLVRAKSDLRAGAYDATDRLWRP